MIGWGGIAGESAGVRLAEECPSCGFLEHSGVTDWSKVLDLDQWDRSDLFIVWPLPRYIMASEKAASVLEGSNLSGIRLTRLAEMRPIEGSLTPGRVSSWLPARRVRNWRYRALFGDGFRRGLAVVSHRRTSYSYDPRNNLTAVTPPSGNGRAIRPGGHRGPGATAVTPPIATSVVQNQ